MSAVTLQRLEDDISAGLCIARNLTARATADNPDGIDLKHEGEYRSLTENLLSTFLENHKAALQYTALYYPERDYPHDCHDWSVTPSDTEGEDDVLHAVISFTNRLSTGLQNDYLRMNTRSNRFKNHSGR